MLNSKYFPGDKWNGEYLKRFHFKPKRFDKKMEILFSTPELSQADKSKKFVITRGLIEELRKLCKNI